MKNILRYFCTSIICLLITSVLFTFTVSAADKKVMVGEHDLSLTLPEEYVLLNNETASDEKELIESYGYTVSSFKSYLKTNQIIMFATAPATKTQISIKSWNSDFSSDAGDMSYLSDEALSSVAKELVTVSGASYKTVSVNSMELLEIRSSGNDSGGNFCSVQYVTIRNGAFYSINFAFSGELDNSKVQNAWDTICTLNIKDTLTQNAWNISSIFEMILIWALIILAVVAVVVVIISFIRDAQNRRSDTIQDVEYIERRDRFGKR